MSANNKDLESVVFEWYPCERGDGREWLGNSSPNQIKLIQTNVQHEQRLFAKCFNYN